MRDALLIARKDLLVERRSRVLLNQVAPFALLVLVLFGFALNADRATLETFAPGLFWIAVLFVGLLAIQRSVAIESADNALTGLRMSGVAPWRVFVGKTLAIVIVLVVLEVLLTAGILILYEATIDELVLFIIVGLVAAVAVACAGSLYGVLAVGLGVRDTILPILLLPVLAPVLIAATRAYDDALGSAAVNGWAWLGFLVIFGVVYGVAGALAYGAVLEDA